MRHLFGVALNYFLAEYRKKCERYITFSLAKLALDQESNCSQDLPPRLTHSASCEQRKNDERHTGKNVRSTIWEGARLY